MSKREEQAAQVLWKHWKARQERREPESADGRWQDALVEAQAKTNLQSAGRGENDPKSRLRRAVFLAGRLQDGEALPPDQEAEPLSDDNSKMLEAQHWLELIDGKTDHYDHICSSVHQFYHKKWQEENTSENFFRWLDHGGGKDLSLPECSREQLEKERIIYLSKEQRENYLVRIDDQGLLRWARNNELVDTRSNRWKDAGKSRNGGGIVPMTVEEMRGAEIREAPAKHGRVGFHSNSTDSLLNSGEAHYLDTVAKPGDSKLKQTMRSHFTSKGIMERLLRKTVKKNTWIYVCDMKRNLFIGIKETGAFQHSSFTAGGLISSAGLITVKMGRIHKLSPLSGHYRTSVDHYRLFLEDLESQGADLGKVQVTKAEVTLWGQVNWDITILSFNSRVIP
ncbi:putative IQ calmodulin-binding motif protein [Rhizoctonia solani 123E]|uniref:Putative IQ calmodulin-binding motif protein n=1 Tax=Rhizoctonia solani 123E TaxID=1423351 RepID=A0A074S6U9_9AGAM|nr:putative IQ calmodulin-binding motif protein [Rhizoctonia solani 123E]